MDVKYVNPFLSSIQNVFDTMLHIQFNLGKPFIKNEEDPRYEVSGLIGLSGTVTGCIVINMSEKMALQLASSLSGEEVLEINRDGIDAIGEITNMITGGAKKDFPGENNSVSCPSIVIGQHEMFYPSGVPIVSIPCETSAGQLSVDIALKESPVSASVSVNSSL